MSGSAAAVEIRGLTKKFGSKPALAGLDLHVRKGTVLGLVGPNGAGKTTTLSILAGLLRPDSGTVNILGTGLFNAAAHKGKISLLPQDSQLPGYMTVMDILIYLGRLQGMSRNASKRDAEALLEWVGLTDRMRSRVRTLSHGMLRRLTVAQAFLGSPELVLLDEPGSGLDPRQIIQIRQLISRHAPNQTIIVSSHILPEIEAVCDEVAFIENGKTLRQSGLRELVNQSGKVTYSVDLAVPPMAALQDRLPFGTFHLSEDQRTLTLEFSHAPMGLPEINRAVLETLFTHGTGVLEVSMGSKLEQEYLRQM